MKTFLDNIKKKEIGNHNIDVVKYINSLEKLFRDYEKWFSDKKGILSKINTLKLNHSIKYYANNATQKQENIIEGPDNTEPQIDPDVDITLRKPPSDQTSKSKKKKEKKK